MITLLLKRLSEAGEHAVVSGSEMQQQYGPAFNRLLRERALEELAPLEDWELCDGRECGLLSRPIRKAGDRYRAECPLDASEDIALKAKDLRRFGIDPEQLAAVLGMVSGFCGAGRVFPGVWHLGRLASGRQVFLCFAPAAGLQPGLDLTLKDIARGAPATLIGPTIDPASVVGLDAASVEYRELDDVLSSSETNFGALDLARLEVSGAVARLAIEQQARRVILDGRAIRLSEQQYNLLYFLTQHAAQGPSPVPTRGIEDHLWGGGIHRISSTLRDPIRALRQALARGSADPDAAKQLIETTRHPQGYRLRLTAEEIAISD